MEKLFQILAVILAGIAAFFWWQGNPDLLFLCAVLGAVSFFAGIRFQVGARVKERRAAEEEEEMRREDETGRRGDAEWKNGGEMDEEEDRGDEGEEERLSESPGLLMPQSIDEQRTTNNGQLTPGDERLTTNDERRTNL